MDTEKSKKSKTWLIVLITLVVVVVLGVVAAGAGLAAKRFGKGGAEVKMGYGRGGMREGKMGKKDFGQGMFGFGRLSGQISSINSTNLVVKAADGTEVNVAIADTTSVYNQNKIAKASDLQVNNSVMVLGKPNSSGVVQAEAIIIR